MFIRAEFLYPFDLENEKHPMSRPHRNRVNPLHKWKSYWVLYFSQSINHSNYKMFNIFDLSDDDRIQMKKM